MLMVLRLRWMVEVLWGRSCSLLDFAVYIFAKKDSVSNQIALPAMNT